MNIMPKIKFLPHDKSIEVEKGEVLIRAALEAGVHINASCGGEGVCGKCRVLIEEGEVMGQEFDFRHNGDFPLFGMVGT
jgi:uncharacterized 2Fe-2S/4Fe-4S cluster protein (DUF4445 family)